MKQQLIKKAPDRVSEINKCKNLHVFAGAAVYEMSNPHITKNKSRSTLKNICMGLKEAGYINASDEVIAAVENHKVTQFLKVLLVRGE